MSIFPTRILLATDGSRDAEFAAITAAELVKATGSELQVVHVDPLIAYARAVRTSESDEDARNVLAGEVDGLRNVGVDVAEAHLKVGLPEEAIVALSEELGAGLIVMGSRGLGGVRRALMGSVSDSVVRHAHCPVLVTRWKAVGFPAKILLATDASEDAHLASSTATELARRAGSELHVVHVGGQVTQGAFPTVQVGALPGTHQDELDGRAKALLEAETERIKSSGSEVTGEHLRRGRADRKIVDLAEEEGADLIVVGSRGLGGMRRALMGSVSDSVVHHAHCPVLIVRSERERTRER